MSEYEHLEKYAAFDKASQRAKVLAKEFGEVTKINRTDGGWSVLVTESVMHEVSKDKKQRDIGDKDEYEDFYTVADLARDCGWDDVEAFEICQLGW